MRLTDEQIIRVALEECGRCPGIEYTQFYTLLVRRCLALAALPDEDKPYEDVERRGFSVSQPGELPR